MLKLLIKQYSINSFQVLEHLGNISHNYINLNKIHKAIRFEKKAFNLAHRLLKIHSKNSEKTALIKEKIIK